MIYWIIKNSKRGKIWKGIYTSKYEAESELRSQTSQMPPDHTAANWKIEECHSRDAPVKNKKDDFDDFN